MNCQCTNQLYYDDGRGNIIFKFGLIGIPYAVLKDRTDVLSITIPSTVQFIGDYAFAGCTSLKEVKCYNPQCEHNPKAFVGCYRVKCWIINPNEASHFS